MKVALAGHHGRVGTALEPALRSAPDLAYVGGAGSSADLGDILSTYQPDVVVDFTKPGSALDNALTCVKAGARPVIGTTGLSQDDLAEIESACKDAGLGGIFAPNFAVGAVVMMHLAEIAAPFFEGAEVIELHHAGKLDAPSGTALATARRLAAQKKFAYNRPEKVTLEHTRGGEEDGVAVHSVRLPGFVADQEVIFGLPGQTLTVMHRTTSREAYAPGVLLAIRKVMTGPKFYRALDELLGLR